MSESIIGQKSFALAERTIRLYKHLTLCKKEFVISNQILRSGTSVGANVVEALEGESRPDFRHKMNIALKESSETLYWLKLLRSGGYLNEIEFRSIYKDAEEVKKILVSIVKNTQDKKD